MRVLADMYACYRPLAYSEDGIDASAIACSKCGGEDTDGPLGDIVLCDARGCDHAFHMRCVSPPLEPAALEGADEDEDWLCPRCGERTAPEEGNRRPSARPRAKRRSQPRWSLRYCGPPRCPPPRKHPRVTPSPAANPHCAPQPASRDASRPSTKSSSATRSTGRSCFQKRCVRRGLRDLRTRTLSSLDPDTGRRIAG